MNEIELGQRLARRLDACVDDLDPRILRRLESARERALDHMREPATTLQRSGMAVRLSGPHHSLPVRLLLPAAVLLIGLTSIFLWQGLGSSVPDGVELELLSDELPINAYLDKGFQQWISPAMQR